MQNAKRKIYHSYRLSYAHEVGSSFDPDLDVPAKPLIEAYAEEYVPLEDFEVLLSPFVRVDNRTSGSCQLDLGPAFRIYIALSVILDPQRALNIGYFLQKFCLYCDLEF